MPSPIGHLIAGAAIGRAVVPSRPRVVLSCAVLAAAADADLLLPQTHRTATHSLTAVLVILIVAIAVTGRVTAIGSGIGYRIRYGVGYRIRYGVGYRYRIVLALVAAYASHIVLDWLGADPTPPHGIQLLWPFSNDWFISGLDLFRGTARRNPFSARSLWINVTAIAQEVAILGPIAWLVFRLRRQ